MNFAQRGDNYYNYETDLQCCRSIENQRHTYAETETESDTNAG